MHRRSSTLLLAAALLAVHALGCRSGEEVEPSQPSAATAGRGSPALDGDAATRAAASARSDMVKMLRGDLDTPRHPADGGGRAWLEATDGAPIRARVGTPGRFPIVYEAGPLGVAEGGMILLQVSPFWGWSTPQNFAPDAPGYTHVSTEAEGVQLHPRTLDQQLMGIEIRGRALASGERVRIVYGAGSGGAVADSFAERESRFWIAVDGDGDGVRKVLEESPVVDVDAADPVRLVLSVPTVVRPGESARLTIAALDAWGNAGSAPVGELKLEVDRAGLELPERVAFESADRGRKTVEIRARREDIYRIRASGPDGLSGESNPMVVAGLGPRVFWGDLHGHSNLSDGTGTAEDYFRYARDVAALDVVALTDHDHWGILFLDRHPALWAEIREQVRRFHEPGRFVTLLGYEWTSWIYGHRHVLYFDDDGEVLSSIDPQYESPVQLWSALEGKAALTFAHHSAGGPIATDWSIAPDPHFEPVTEIVSVHGSSEAADSPGGIYSPVAGNYVRDALGLGYRFGFVGSGDSHDGHPGLAHLSARTGGLAAVLAEELTREGVLAALRARRVYATNGPRMLLRMSLATRPMGSALKLRGEELEEAKLVVIAVGTAPLERVDVVRSGAVVASVPASSRLEFSFERALTRLRPGEYVYARVVQEDGGVAWSSPIYVE